MKHCLWAVFAVAVLWCPLRGQVRTAPPETIWLGTNLTLGMPEDTVIRKLTESGYTLEKLKDFPVFQRQKGITSMWVTKEKQGDIWISHDLGFASGKLELVVKELTTRDEVEFGRQLYFAMHDLEAEGNRRCTIETTSQEGPDSSMKTAKLHCGKKGITINLQQWGKQAESVELDEELSGHPTLP
jgi:hypothetical protein